MPFICIREVPAVDCLPPLRRLDLHALSDNVKVVLACPPLESSGASDSRVASWTVLESKGLDSGEGKESSSRGPTRDRRWRMIGLKM
ncbi:hypothetical protein PAPYR_4466 [Paratrimastix pyriformis]|uniref:Uncharacterized protein n=1 Tax=Paratrimastix pyriformis TaxID=342808 RepID=A0ABQ8UNY2_9EUKA|nr:hypothetical protein PAPYR_4466 [Paratrimastix pyriformis]